MKRKIKISVVVPVYNEEKNVKILSREILTVLKNLKKPFEIIFVDDGSTDKTFQTLKVISNIKVIRLWRNFGQTAALSAGIDESRGQYIITLDGDLQNDPKDIPKLLKKIEEGYGLVNGWRYQRNDSLFKKIPSWVANTLISVVSGVKFHDYGCTLKAFRAQVVKDLRLYGEMHRFIPALAFWQGINMVEIKVRHRKRKYGVSKYGLGRTPRVILDLVTIKFLLSYFYQPMKIFGLIGLLFIFIGFLISSYLAFQRIFLGLALGNRPVLLLGVFLMIVGIQFLGIGLLSEIMVRVYYEVKKDRPYRIREVISSGRKNEFK